MSNPDDKINVVRAEISALWKKKLTEAKALKSHVRKRKTTQVTVASLLEVPSGKLVVGAEFTDHFVKPSDLVVFTATGSVGEDLNELIERAQCGCMQIPTRKSYPNLYQTTDGTYVLSQPGEMSEEEWGLCENNVGCGNGEVHTEGKQVLTPPGDEHYCSFVDHNIFLEEGCVDCYEDIEVLTVRPGVYKVETNMLFKFITGVREPETIATLTWVRETDETEL